jgi:WD40 repeat protein
VKDFDNSHKSGYQFYQYGASKVIPSTRIKCLGEKSQRSVFFDAQAVLTSANGFAAKIGNSQIHSFIGFPKQTQAINTVDYLQEGDRYLTAAFDSTARIYDGTGRLIDSLKHNGVVLTAFFSPDGNHILTASQDSTPGYGFQNNRV